ncbi:hypothetical protein K438DRAFT_1865537 [Mycena galopus ATCC 62051]|nr:hypothetical protein K438DRAFT_1865537 [Mycena galopus ATCC 62051]
MVIDLCALPADIILEVVNFLDAQDAISLLLTCSTLYTLSGQRSFWISVLKTTQNKFPIACPPDTDLSQLTLEVLKDLVFSWQKLQDNWNLPSPKIVRPVISTRLPVPGHTEILVDVQGTDILVLNSGESVFCWDSKLAIPFPFPAIYCGVIRAVSSHDASGVCTIALSTDERPQPDRRTAHRYVITIKHANGKAISFSHEVIELLISDSDIEAFSFTTEDATGSIVVADDHCSITASPISGNTRLAGSATLLKLHRSVSRREMINCLAYKGHLYILLEDRLSIQVQHISRRNVRSGRCEESGRYICDKAFPVERKPFVHAVCTVTPSTALYGISAVFVRLDGDLDDTHSSTAFTFLTNHFTHTPDDGVSSPLAFDSPTVTEYVPGTLRHPGLVWLDHSGLNLAAVVWSGSDDPSLVLVRCHPKTRSISLHTLVVPSSIDFHKLDGLCIDETAGAIHLMDREGLLSTMRYV